MKFRDFTDDESENPAFQEFAAQTTPHHDEQDQSGSKKRIGHVAKREVWIAMAIAVRRTRAGELRNRKSKRFIFVVHRGACWLSFSHQIRVRYPIEGR